VAMASHALRSTHVRTTTVNVAYLHSAITLALVLLAAHASVVTVEMERTVWRLNHVTLTTAIVLLTPIASMLDQASVFVYATMAMKLILLLTCNANPLTIVSLERVHMDATIKQLAHSWALKTTLASAMLVSVVMAEHVFPLIIASSFQTAATSTLCALTLTQVSMSASAMLVSRAQVRCLTVSPSTLVIRTTATAFPPKTLAVPSENAR